MKRLTSALCLLLALGCSKPKPPANEFDLDASSDDSFVKAANYFQGNSFTFEQFDRAAHTISTQWKELSLEEFLEAAIPRDNPDRYMKGRIRYKITLTDQADKAHIKIDVEVEGFLIPRQAGDANYGTKNVWEPATSKGVAEKTVFGVISS